MRRFWLKKDGEIWDLSAEIFTGWKYLTDNITIQAGASFMSEPQGLGVKAKINSSEVERSAFIESIKIESAEISGKLYFRDYAQFIDFGAFIGCIDKTEVLQLYYSTAEKKPDYISANEWYKLVLIKELKKGEIDAKTGVLICDVKFFALSPWKKDQMIILDGTKDIFIDNTGNLPTPCTIRVEAETDTPSFILYKNGAPYERGQYNIFIQQGYYMIINSDPTAQEASLNRETPFPVDDDKQSIYNLGERDYRYSNFITIPSGRSTFRFNAKNTPFGKVTLSYSLQKELI